MGHKKSTKMQTFSGIAVDLKNPDPNTILVPDLAHHLSQICRFTGACRKTYSVAQHSVFVSRLIPDGKADSSVNWTPS